MKTMLPKRARTMQLGHKERELLKRKFLIIMFFLLVWAILTILAVSWGIRYDWPDNVHVDYGLPLVWATHTTSTIIGTVDIWTVDIPSLIMDLSLWIGTMIIGASIIFYVLTNHKKEKKSIAKVMPS